MVTHYTYAWSSYHTRETSDCEILCCIKSS